MARKDAAAPLDARAAEIREIEERFRTDGGFRAEFLSWDVSSKLPADVQTEWLASRPGIIVQMAGRSPWKYTHGLDLLRAIDERLGFDFGRDGRTYSIRSCQTAKAEIELSSLDWTAKE